MRLKIAAVALFIKDNKIALLYRQNTGKNDGMYALIGGKVEIGESVRDGLIREIAEEVGVVVNPYDVELVHCVSSWQEDKESLALCFLIKKWSGNLINKEPHLHADITWFALDALPSDLVARNRHVIEMVQKGIRYSEWGWKNK